MNMTHRARGCPFIANMDGEDFVIDGFAKYKGYGDDDFCNFTSLGE